MFNHHFVSSPIECKFLYKISVYDLETKLQSLFSIYYNICMLLFLLFFSPARKKRYHKCENKVYLEYNKNKQISLQNNVSKANNQN